MTIHPILVAELREARLATDRLKVERSQLLNRIVLLEQEAEAQRDFISLLAHNGEGAVL